jgi:integrase
MHLHRLPSGTWRVEIRHNGQRRTGTARTKAEAQRVGAELLLDMGGTPSASKQTVAALVAMHLADNEYSHTYRSDLARIAERIPPAFAARAVTDVTPVVVDHLYRTLARDGWTPHRIARLQCLLGAAFKRAKRWGWVEVIPTRDAAMPKLPPRKDTTPTVADVVALLAVADADTAFGVFVRLAASTGARRAELCGLQWTDVDFDRGVLSIARSVTYTPDAGLVIGPTKTAKSTRPLPLGADMLARLRSWRSEQARLALSRGLPGAPWIFTSDHVNPWRPDFATHRWGRVRADAGLPAVRLHDLRHYVGSDMIAAGINVRTVSDQLGHSSATMTLNRYASGVDAAQRAAVDYIEQRLRG